MGGLTMGKSTVQQLIVHRLGRLPLAIKLAVVQVRQHLLRMVTAVRRAQTADQRPRTFMTASSKQQAEP